MRFILAIAITLCACSSKRTKHYAVGAKDYHASPVSCSIVDNAAGALVATTDHYWGKGGNGVVFEAVKPGKARIECQDSNYNAKIEVREPAKVELRSTDESRAPFPVGASAPGFCLRAFDKDGVELELGILLEGAKFLWSEHVHRVVDHGMGGPQSSSCIDEGRGHKEGAGTVTATWRGFSAKADFEVKGTSR